MTHQHREVYTENGSHHNEQIGNYGKLPVLLRIVEQELVGAPLEWNMLILVLLLASLRGGSRFF